MNKIIYTRADGGLSVFNPVEGARLASSVTLAGDVLTADEPQSVDQFLRRWPVDGAIAEWAETEEEFIARISPKSIPADASNIAIVDPSAIPADRTFREAWAHGGKTVIVDMGKAVEIHKGRLREIRQPLLAALDVKFMKALEAGDTKARDDIVTAKQALRDVTSDPALGAAKTPEALKAVMPAALVK